MIKNDVINFPVNACLSIYDINSKIIKDVWEDINKFANTFTDMQNSATNVKSDMSSWHCWEEEKAFLPFSHIIEDICGRLPWMAYNTYYNDPNTGEMLKTVPMMIDLWVARYKKNDFTISHDHNGSANISFVYYLKTDETCAPIVFGEGAYTHTPKQGELIVFPAWLEHSVPKQESDSSRIVIAGNMRLVPHQMHKETWDERYKLVGNKQSTRRIEPSDRRFHDDEPLQHNVIDNNSSNQLPSKTKEFFNADFHKQKLTERQNNLAQSVKDDSDTSDTRFVTDSPSENSIKKVEGEFFITDKHKEEIQSKMMADQSSDDHSKYNNSMPEEVSDRISKGNFLSFGSNQNDNQDDSHHYQKVIDEPEKEIVNDL